MNVLLIYFSQTGGTEKIAYKIKDGTLNSNHNCDIIEMKKTMNIHLESYDLIGIGTPTFYYREPINVKNFIQKMKNADGKHCFIFCTHGSVIGNTFYYMEEELSKKGYVVIGNFDSYSASSLQFYPEIMHTIKHPDEIELEEALNFGKNICDISLRVKNGETDLIPKFNLIEDTWWAKQSKTLTLDFLRRIFPKFEINEEMCTKCLTCQKNCPTDVIDVEVEPPEIQKESCIFCGYCEKSCPEGAIETDWKLMRVGSKGNLKLYMQELKKAEEQGKFRPYVDYEKII
jgi:flavodoxin/NAD-dependent dihydropyrimidine dehydrogenase PreA subunit